MDRRRTLARSLGSLFLLLALAPATFAWQVDEDDGDGPPTLPETEVEGDPVDDAGDDFDPTDAAGDMQSLIDSSVFASPPAFGYGAESNTTASDLVRRPDGPAQIGNRKK